MVESSRFGDCPDDPQEALGPRASDDSAPHTHEAPNSRAGDSSHPASPPPPTFRRLARRITDWTTRLLLAGVILVVGLAFGRQVLRWWRADQVAPNVGALGPGATGPQLDSAQVICFGRAGWTLRHQRLEGDRQAVLAALRAQCRPAAAQGISPAEPLLFEEQSLLARLASQPAVEHQPGRWRMYELDEGVPMVVVLADGGKADHPSDGASLAAPSVGVITWGMAVPQSSAEWILYAFQPEARAPPASSEEVPIALPPEADRVLAVQMADGSGIAGFEMAGPAERAKGVFDRWCAERGWRASGPWQGLGDAWCRRFESSGPQGLHTVDVRLGATADGRMRGVVASWGLPALKPADASAP